MTSILFSTHQTLLTLCDYENSEHDKYANLLKCYFDESYNKFVENEEYLFFIGIILYIAEWYFGIDDDSKPVESRECFRMQKKASEKVPSNILFEWAWRFSLGEKEIATLFSKSNINT